MRAITIIGLAALLLAQGAAAAVQDKDQRKCLVGFEKGVARFAKTAGRASLACLKDASKGKGSLGSCVADDPKGTVGRAEDKTRAMDERVCGDRRADFGVTDAPGATASVRHEREGLLEALFGAPYDDAAATAKAEARCQATALRGAAKVADAHWRAAAHAGKRAAAGAVGVVDFEQAVWSDLAGSAKLDQLAAKTRSKVDLKCSGVEAASLPGFCGAGDTGQCVATAGACHFCRGWNAAAGTAFDCDSYDNGSEDASCESTGGVLYVSTTGSDADDGTPDFPLATLGTALTRAESEGYGRIRIAAGNYAFGGDEVRNGVSIQGGFDASTWAEGGGETVLASSGWVGLYATDITAPTELVDLTIESADASSGGSSYAVQASNSRGLRIRNTVLRAGDGGDGVNGGTGSPGHDGDPGSRGSSCTGGGCYSVNYGGSGGDQYCAGAGGRGGRGGDIPTPGLFEGDGIGGGSGSPGSAGGGGGGDECFGIFPLSCTGDDGSRGTDGDDASPDTRPAPSATNAAGFPNASGWFGEGGFVGDRGDSGNGGGGGGGGGGRALQPSAIWDTGGGGGGGGEGGCGGYGGRGGQAGGGSFGLYAFDSDVTLEDVTALAGRGGRGGNGGDGGEGGDGGSGARGGTSEGGGTGGRGGNGGDGADGQDGGAGAGGIAFGVYAPGASTISQLGSNDFQAVEGGEGGSPSGVRGDSGGFGD